MRVYHVAILPVPSLFNIACSGTTASLCHQRIRSDGRAGLPKPFYVTSNLVAVCSRRTSKNKQMTALIKRIAEASPASADCMRASRSGPSFMAAARGPHLWWSANCMTPCHARFRTATEASWLPVPKSKGRAIQRSFSGLLVYLQSW